MRKIVALVVATLMLVSLASMAMAENANLSLGAPAWFSARLLKGGPEQALGLPGIMTQDEIKAITTSTEPGPELSRGAPAWLVARLHKGGPEQAGGFTNIVTDDERFSLGRGYDDAGKYVGR